MTPTLLASLAVEAEHCELLGSGRPIHHATAAGTTSPPTTGTIRSIGPLCRRTTGIRSLCRRLCPGRNRRENKNLILPDDRRGGPPPRDAHLPLHVLGFAPLGRRVGIGSHAARQRTTPGRPIRGCGCLKRNPSAPKAEGKGREFERMGGHGFGKKTSEVRRGYREQLGVNQGLGRPDSRIEVSGTESLKVFRKATSADWSSRLKWSPPAGCLAKLGSRLGLA